MARSTTHTRSDTALELMLGFAERTGLTSNEPPDRYLWTDAFAVCNFLALGRMDLALQLVDQVHHVLGRHRPDDVREGSISGLSGAEADAHPTAGGLRIGKALPERAEGTAMDHRLEWDSDGQYFHYLTRWMHALAQVGSATEDAAIVTWARELANAAADAFIHETDGSGRRMHWKMSIDLSRPLVASMGQHDPLDGYVTALELGADDLADRFVPMIPRDLATTDPLGLGGLLTDAWRLDRLGEAHAALRDRLLSAAGLGLAAYLRMGDLEGRAEGRLPFRELGLAIGLAAVPLMGTRAVSLMRFHGVRDDIVAFWLHDEHRVTRGWREHQNINDVMLATSLAPAGYLSDRRLSPALG